MVIETVLRGEKFIAIRAVQPYELFLEDFITIDTGWSCTVLRPLFLVNLSHVEAFDMPIKVIFHLEKAITVWAFEHITRVKILVDRAHMITHRMQTSEGFEAQFTLCDAFGCA